MDIFTEQLHDKITEQEQGDGGIFGGLFWAGETFPEVAYGWRDISWLTTGPGRYRSDRNEE